MGNYKIFFFFFVLAIFLFLPKPIFGADDVVINEFSSAFNPEWIEIYNPTSQNISLSGVVLILDDDPETNQKMSFCENEEIAASSFKQIVRPTKSYWLNNDGDAIFLKREDDVIDAIFYGTGQSLEAPSETQSASRNPDGGIDWVILDTPTPQGDIVSFECPTPTPEPTEEPEPTGAPTPTPTPSPTPTPTKKPTPTLIPTPTGEILGEEESATNAFYPLEATPEAESTSQSGSSFKTRWLPKILLGIGFLLLFGASFWVWYTKLRWPEQESS